VVLLAEPHVLAGDSNANLVFIGARTLPTETIARLASIAEPTATSLYGDSLAEFHATAAPLTDDEPVDGPKSLRPSVSACG
jgi:hypothetical protein